MVELLAKPVEKNKKFLNYIHYFRGFAIVLIVGAHACIALDWGANVFTRKLMISFLSNGTILFVFISGFLFYFLGSEKFGYSNFLKKKFKYVVLPYLIVSVPAVIDKLYFDEGAHWWMDEHYKQLALYEKVIYMLLTGKHSGVLWFIPMMVVFYIISPLLLFLSKSKGFKWIVAVIFLPGLFLVSFGYYSNTFFSFLYFVPIYLLGMLVARHREKVLDLPFIVVGALMILYTLATIMEVTGFIPLEELRVYNLSESGFMFNYGKLKATILAIILLYLFYRIGTRSAAPFALLTFLGDYSFGIFFLHLYVINVLVFIGSQAIGEAYFQIFSFLLFTITTVALSSLMVFIVKKIFKSQSRLIIGS